jgi:hypothetical protein
MAGGVTEGRRIKRIPLLWLPRQGGQQRGVLRANQAGALLLQDGQQGIAQPVRGAEAQEPLMPDRINAPCPSARSPPCSIWCRAR